MGVWEWGRRLLRNRIGTAFLILLLSSPERLDGQAARGAAVRVKTKAGEEIGLYAESHALLVGISKYTAGWPNLESIPGELAEIEAALKGHGFASVSRVLDLSSEELKAAIEQFINEHGFQTENRLVIVFSGHGHTRKDGKKGYLVPADAPEPQVDEIGFARKAIEMEQVITWARKIEAKHVLFLFDSCFSGTVFKSKESPVPRDVTVSTAKPVREFISAGSAGETVPARSVFSPSFIRGINGEADLDRDGYVTGTELGSYLRKKVMSYETGQTPQFGKIRDPELDEGDVVFVAPKTGSVSAVPRSEGVDFTDLTRAAEVRRQWQAWQEKMGGAFESAWKLNENAGLTANEKAEAWKRFLAAYPEDNPTSQDDEMYRDIAREQQQHWENGRVAERSPAVPEHQPEGNLARSGEQIPEMGKRILWCFANRRADEAWRILGSIPRESWPASEEGLFGTVTRAEREPVPEEIRARGLAALSRGSLTEAVLELQEVLRERPGDTEASSGLKRAMAGMADLASALSAYRDGDYETAIRLTRPMRSPGVANGNAEELLFRAYFNDGLLKLQAGSSEAASASFREAARLRPSDAEVTAHLAFIERFPRGPIDLPSLIYVKYVRPRP